MYNFKQLMNTLETGEENLTYIYNNTALKVYRFSADFP